MLYSVVFEELPLNLMALKEKIERMFTSSTSDEAQNTMLDPALSSEYDGHHVSARDLIEDFDYLQRVIQYHYSARGKMFPTREELRAGRLSTVEKAIMAHGGRKKVSKYKLKFFAEYLPVVVGPLRNWTCRSMCLT